MVETDRFLGALFFERSARVLGTPEPGSLEREPMSTNVPGRKNGHDSSTEPDDRTRKAVTECMGILPEGGDLYTVVGENHPDREQSEYTVDLRRGRCSCADSEYRDPDGGCKHARRVKFATGEVPVPAAFSPDDVPGRLGGDHLDGEPRFLTTDGGSAEFTERAKHLAAQVEERVGEEVRVPVAGGVLVYEKEIHGKTLVGFESVTDWDALGDAVAERGHSRGDVLHLPELDE